MSTHSGTKRYYLWIIGLVGLMALGICMSCGKLSDDTNRPSSPTGTSGGVPVPVGPQSSVGTYTLTLRANPDTIPADLMNFTTLHAKITDTSGRSVENFIVHFETDTNSEHSENIAWFWDDKEDGGYYSEITAYTDAEGTTSVRMYGNKPGSVTPMAKVDLDSDGFFDLSATVNVFLTTSGPPSTGDHYSFSMWAEPDTIPADMATYSTIIAQVRDASGGPVHNFRVTFHCDSGYLVNDPQYPELLTTVTAVTDSNGRASVYFYADRAGSAVIDGSVYIGNLNYSSLYATTTVHVTSGPGVPGEGIPGIILGGAPLTQVIEAEDTGYAEADPISLSAHVWDESGHPAQSGVRVTFQFSGDITGTYYSTTGTGEDPNEAAIEVSIGMLPIGEYYFTVTASVTINGQTYTSTIGGYIKIIPPEPTVDLTLTATPTEIQTGQTATVTATLTVNGTATSGVTINFGTNIGTLSPTSAATNVNGMATVTFTAPGSPGTANITASTSIDGIGATADVSVEIADAPATIDMALTPPSPYSLPNIGSQQSVTATATVRNSSGNTVSGFEVKFTINETCGDFTFNPETLTVATDANGIANFPFTITSTAAGAPQCNFTINATAGSAAGTITGTIN